MKAKIRNYIVTGLLVVVPITFTGYIIFLIITVMDKFMRLLPGKIHPDTYLPFHLPGLGLVLTFILILFIGMVTRSLLGRKIVSLGEWVLSQIPLVRNVYNAAKQLSEAMFKPKSESFRRVILVEYPRKELYVLGFVTGTAIDELQEKTSKNVINVFIPTTPNPTSGFYILVPEEDAISLEMTVEEAFKLIISGGMVRPSPKGPIQVAQPSIELSKAPQQLNNHPERP